MGDLFQPTHLLLLAFIGTFFVFVPKIFYILTLQNTMNKCHPTVRTMDPGMCWLYLVPIVAIIWHFFMVSAVANTVGAEFSRRGIPSPEPRPGYSLGQACCVCGCVALIPLINLMAIPAQLVLWIMYWVKVSEFSRLLSFPISMPVQPPL